MSRAQLTSTVEQNTGGAVSPYVAGKNKIINGNMVIDQRNNGSSVTPNVNYTLDRWQGVNTQTSKFTVQRNAGSITPPSGFAYYLGATSSSAYSVVTGDTFYICQYIEGNNSAEFGFGTASAKTVTLSFYAYSSLTGTFGGSLANSAGNRSYPFSYTIGSANTWERKTVTIAGDTTGTWLTDSGIGIQVRIGLGSGATYSGTANSWAAANYVQPTSSVSVVGTNGATFYVTGVQLEAGSVATAFTTATGTLSGELAACQRYYCRQGGDSVYQTFGSGWATATNGVNIKVKLPVTMRVTPTVLDSGSLILFDEVNAGVTFSGLAIIGTQSGKDLVFLAPSSVSGLTQYRSYDLSANNSISAYVGFGAEL